MEIDLFVQAWAVLTAGAGAPETSTSTSLHPLLFAAKHR